MPPIPHLAVAREVQEQELPPPPVKAPIWKKRNFQIGALAAVVVLGAGGFFAFSKLTAPPPPPPPKPKPAAPVAAAPKPAAPAATTAPAPALANKPAQPAPALSETQSAIAHAPVNAINKAKDVIAKREGSGQGRDAIATITDGDSPSAPAAKSAATTAAAGTQSVATSSAIAPGVSATNDNVLAAAEASPAFRSYVANAKVSGVFQGSPARVMLNGRLIRAGDLVDPTLAITFDSVDSEKKLILFKDKSGAVVTRRY